MATALTRYIVAAGITTAAVCAWCSSSRSEIAIETEYVGHNGDKCYSLRGALFEIRSSRSVVYYNVSESENGSLLTLKDQNSPKVYKLRAKTSRATRFEIPVEVKELRGVPNVPMKASIELVKSLDEKSAYAFPAWAKCDPVGYHPIVLFAIIVPGRLEDFRKWVTQHAELLITTNILSPEADGRSEVTIAPQVENVREIGVIEGNEKKVLSLIRQSGIVIDAIFEPMPLGPDAELIDFRRRPAIKNSDTQADVMDRIKRLVHDSFPAAKPGEYAVKVDRGTVYRLSIIGPANHFVPGREFADRWLITSVTLRFFKNQVGDGFIDRLLMDIPDGFLPKWPADSAEPPQEPHYRQFHLSPDGTGPTENFSALTKLQDEITQAFIVKWKGELAD
jgi:hypothetical protein